MHGRKLSLVLSSSFFRQYSISSRIEKLFPNSPPQAITNRKSMEYSVLENIDQPKALGLDKNNVPPIQTNSKAFNKPILSASGPLGYSGQVQIKPASLDIRMPKIYNEFEQPKEPKLLKVAILGPANAGKSTLLNALLNTEVSIVSPRPQTTRKRTQGILTEEDIQIIFLDTPGVVPKNPLSSVKLQRDVLTAPWNTLDEADYLIMMLDAYKSHSVSTYAEEFIFEKLQRYKVPGILILNKIDLMKDHDAVELLSDRYNQKYSYFNHTVKASIIKNIGLAEIKALLFSNAYPSNWLYPKNVTTDCSDYETMEEAVRGEYYQRLRSYLPYVFKQENIGWTELPDGTLRIDQNLMVLDKAHEVSGNNI